MFAYVYMFCLQNDPVLKSCQHVINLSQLHKIVWFTSFWTFIIRVLCETADIGFVEAHVCIYHNTHNAAFELNAVFKCWSIERCELGPVLRRVKHLFRWWLWWVSQSDLIQRTSTRWRGNDAGRFLSQRRRGAAESWVSLEQEEDEGMKRSRESESLQLSCHSVKFGSEIQERRSKILEGRDAGQTTP